MDDEEVAKFALYLRAHLELTADYLDNYEKNLLPIASIHTRLIEFINFILSGIQESLPANKLDELIKPIIANMKETHYYLEEK